MKKSITNVFKAVMVVAMVLTITWFNIPRVGDPTDFYYDIAPIETQATEASNDFVERALSVGEGYEFVEFISTSDTEVSYIVYDSSNGFQYKITYCETTEGCPVSNIMVYTAPQS